MAASETAKLNSAATAVSSTVNSQATNDPTLTPDQWNEAVKELRGKNLLLPIQGVAPASLKGSFYQRRGSEMHRAVDILAPRNTPIQAVDNGKIAKLWLSKAGGITIYQYDPAGKYVYYYAHLQRYADGLKDNQPVQRGQVIGFVGTSGDAPKNTPHLHFTIYRAPAANQWWKGAPVDPWEIFR